MKTMTIELTSASKYAKGTRLLIKVKKEAFLGTVTATRQGEVYLLLDNNEKVKVKERSKLILGEGVKRKVKKPISLDDIDSALKGGNNVMTRIKTGKGKLPNPKVVKQLSKIPKIFPSSRKYVMATSMRELTLNGVQSKNDLNKILGTYKTEKKQKETFLTEVKGIAFTVSIEDNEVLSYKRNAEIITIEISTIVRDKYSYESEFTKKSNVENTVMNLCNKLLKVVLPRVQLKKELSADDIQKVRWFLREAYITMEPRGRHKIIINDSTKADMAFTFMSEKINKARNSFRPGPNGFTVKQERRLSDAADKFASDFISKFGKYIDSINL